MVKNKTCPDLLLITNTSLSNNDLGFISEQIQDTYTKISKLNYIICIGNYCVKTVLSNPKTK